MASAAGVAGAKSRSIIISGTPFGVFSRFAIGAAMAACAIGDVGNPFLAMLSQNARRLMLVAAITRVLPIGTALMAGGAGDIVMSIECKEFAMVKRRWPPRVSLMASDAGILPALMQRIARCLMTRLAVAAGGWFQQPVIELRLNRSGQSRTRMVTMAGSAIALLQRLVERRPGVHAQYRLSFGSTQADMRQFVASHAPLRRRTTKRRMAGKA